jgi:hypothetical protein
MRLLKNANGCGVAAKSFGAERVNLDYGLDELEGHFLIIDDGPARLFKVSSAQWNSFL